MVKLCDVISDDVEMNLEMEMEITLLSSKNKCSGIYLAWYRRTPDGTGAFHGVSALLSGAFEMKNYFPM